MTQYESNQMNTSYWGALYKRVARHPLCTSANWYMIYNRTQGIDTANSKITRILTFVLNASPVSWAV